LEIFSTILAAIVGYLNSSAIQPSGACPGLFSGGRGRGEQFQRVVAIPCKHEILKILLQIYIKPGL